MAATWLATLAGFSVHAASVVGAGDCPSAILFFDLNHWVNESAGVVQRVGEPVLLSTYHDPTSYVGWAYPNVWRECDAPGCGYRMLYQGWHLHEGKEVGAPFSSGEASPHCTVLKACKMHDGGAKSVASWQNEQPTTFDRAACEVAHTDLCDQVTTLLAFLSQCSFEAQLTLMLLACHVACTMHTGHEADADCRITGWRVVDPSKRRAGKLSRSQLCCKRWWQ